MKELIVIGREKVGEGSIQTINARDLHEFLGAKKMFAHWIKDRIEKYGFVENQDYVCLPVLASEGRGGQNRIDYHLSLDMAKELSMVERNAKGKEARAYFIECERVALHPPAPVIDIHAALNDPAAMRGILLNYTEKVIELENKVSEQAPLVAALDRISTADGMMCITDAAKVLQIRPKDLFAWLSANHWIYRRAGCKNWIGYQGKIQQGVLFHKVNVLTMDDGSEKIRESVKLTAKGIAFLAKVFDTPQVPCPTKKIPAHLTIN